MRIIRFDSVGGASGDMILGAFAQLGADLDTVEKALHSLFPDSFRFERKPAVSFGMKGEIFSVCLEESDSHCGGHSHCDHSHADHAHGEHSHAAHSHHDHSHADHAHEGHFHRSFADIKRMIEESSLGEEVKADSIAVFAALAEAEGEVHAKRPEEVTFHEVGAADSIIDIVGSVLAFRQLGIDGISLSPLPVGSGTVNCAHGIYPVPAPATTALLRNFALPVSLDGEECEMLTPTGAALLGFWKKTPPHILQNAVLKKAANSFGHREMKTRPNLLRASLYEIPDDQIPPHQFLKEGKAGNLESLNQESPTDSKIEYTEQSSEEAKDGQKSETLVQLEANLDDATGEILADAANRLFQAGALDVWLTPIQMKKGRPAHLLSVLTRPDNRDRVLDTLFRTSGTFGVREIPVLRHALARRWQTVQTPYGPVRIKIGTRHGIDLHFTPEFADCQPLAAKFGVSLADVYRAALAAFEDQRQKEEKLSPRENI